MMAGDVSSETLELLQVAAFFGIVWGIGRVFRFVHAQLVGEIIAGIVVSVHVLDWLPFEHCVRLIGLLGLVLLVMEGGLSVNTALLPKIGGRALLIAVTGTIIPVLLGWGVIQAFGKGQLEAVAAGAALSSTSIGMASKMLQSAGQLHTPIGNLIAVAAMVDDILSLVILAVLQRLSDVQASDSDGMSATATSTTALHASSTAATSAMPSTSTMTPPPSNEDSAWVYVEPVVVSVGMIAGGVVLTTLIPRLEKLVPWKSDAQREVGVVFAMLALTALLVLLAAWAGTTILLGAFLAGMAFSNVDGACAMWGYYIPLNEVLTTVFFATIGLVIPVGDLFDPVSIGYGLIYTLPAIVGKLLTGVFMCDRREALVVGWAMVGRGELGFLMAQQALENGLVDKQTFITSVWALLICTLISPVLMRWALRRLHEANKDNDGDTDQTQRDGALSTDDPRRELDVAHRSGIYTLSHAEMPVRRRSIHNAADDHELLQKSGSVSVVYVLAEEPLEAMPVTTL